MQVQENLVKIDPVPMRNVTLPKVAKGLNQIHLCLEDHKDTTEKNFINATQDAARIDSKVEDVNRKVEALATAFEPWRKLGEFLVSNGRKLIWTTIAAAIGAWMTIIVQQDLNHRAEVATYLAKASPIHSMAKGAPAP